MSSEMENTELYHKNCSREEILLKCSPERKNMLGNTTKCCDTIKHFGHGVSCRLSLAPSSQSPWAL